MPEDLVISSTKPTAVAVPLGSDKRKAASVRAPLQNLANWLQWLEDRLSAVLTGAHTFVTLNGNTVTCNTVNAGTVNSVDGTFTGLLKPNGGIKNLAVEITQGNATLARNTYTKVNGSGSSDFTLTIDGSGSPVAGEWVQVYYIGTGNCTIKAPDGTTTVAGLNGSTGIVARVVLIGSNWRVVG